MVDESDDTLRIILIVVAAIVLGPMVLGLLMLPMMGTMGAWWFGDTAGHPFGLWVLVWQLVPLLILVGIGWLAVRWYRNQPGHRGDPALEELRLALARGEIDREEYEERKAMLTDDESGDPTE